MLTLIFLTHFTPMYYFISPEVSQKTSGFLTFSVGIDVEDWRKMVNVIKSMDNSSA